MLVERLLPGVRSRMKRAARAIPAHDFGPGRGLRVGRSGRRSWLMRFKSNTLAECNGRLNVYCWGIMWQSGRVANCLFAGFRARRGRRCPDGTSIRYQPDRRGGLLEPFRLRWTHSAEADLVRDQVDRRRAWRCHGRDGTRRDRAHPPGPFSCRSFEHEHRVGSQTAATQFVERLARSTAARRAALLLVDSPFANRIDSI